MIKIAREAERYRDYHDYLLKMIRNVPKPINVSESIASSTVLGATQIGAGLIIVTTELGGTARLVAKYRAEIPVIAATLVAKTARQLSINFGLVPYYHTGSPETVVLETMKRAVRLGLCKPGQKAVVTSGQAHGFIEGTTTTMQIITIPEMADI
jgi:pyruvate kinase